MLCEHLNAWFFFVDVPTIHFHGVLPALLQQALQKVDAVHKVHHLSAASRLYLWLCLPSGGQRTNEVTTPLSESPKSHSFHGFLRNVADVAAAGHPVCPV